MYKKYLAPKRLQFNKIYEISFTIKLQHLINFQKN
jgi:hypothetical protein